VDEGAALHFTALGSDTDVPANVLSYHIILGAESGMTLDPSTGVFSWTPTETQGPRDYTLRLQVLDDAAVNPLPGLTDVRIHVNEVNQGPTLAAIADVTVHEGAPLYFAVSGSDTDLPANTLTYEIASGTAPGMSLDPVTGNVGWTPTEDQGPATYPVTIRVLRHGGSAGARGCEALPRVPREDSPTPIRGIMTG